MLELRDVQARYLRRPVLLGVDLTVEPGETVALLGPNGAGKSTVLKAILGLVEVTGGSLALAGESLLGRRTAARLAAGLAYLPQGGQVYGPLTVLENLRLAAQLLPGDAAARVAEALERFPLLADRRRARARDLSGGQRQQLAVAMALLGRPRVLLVDEPTIGLAPDLAERALAVIDEVRRASGAAALLVEQNVPLALARADRAALLVGGRIVAVAVAAELRADESRYRQFLYGMTTSLSTED